MTALKWILTLCLLLCFGWLLSGALAYGIFLGAWQGNYPLHARILCADDKAQAWRIAKWGPFGLVAVVGGMLADRQPWQEMQWTCEEEKKKL